MLQAWTIKPKSEGTDRYAEIAKQVTYDLIELYGPGPEDHGLPDYAVLEVPDAWTRAGANVESIEKLCTVVGIIFGVCTVFGATVRVYRPSEWKGRKKKQTTQRELALQGYDLERLGWDDNACDAAALALWAEGQIRVESIET